MSMQDVNKKTASKRSLILKYFTPDICLEVFKTTLMGEIDNNTRSYYIKELLTKYNIPYTGLGNGTNRMGVLIDGYVFKIALDDDGMIDNKREMLYTKAIQPDVIKVYECIPNGLIAVCEYVSIFTLNDFNKYQEEMLEILTRISENFFIGDVGISPKNYVNWGIRNDGSICILDFAYIYATAFRTFLCDCEDEGVLRYDKNRVNLICPACGKKYTFGDIRRRITRKQQAEEIGDITRVGYVLHHPEEVVTVVPEFEPDDPFIEKKKKKEESEEMKEYDAVMKEFKKQKKQMKKYRD